MDERQAITLISRGIEFSGVIILVAGLVFATWRFLFGRRLAQQGEISLYQQYRRDLGRGILLGLEVLVAADIISTVTISPTLESVLVLAIVVLVRTFLSFSLELEIEGRFPWQRRTQADGGQQL
jgi:uncharacterized membrane protein